MDKETINILRQKFFRAIGKQKRLSATSVKQTFDQIVLDAMLESKPTPRRKSPAAPPKPKPKPKTPKPAKEPETNVAG